MSGFVYFMQAGEDGAIKIGFSASSVAARMQGNQVGCPHTLTLLGVIPGDVALERRWHKVFRACRLRGEWFSPNRRLLDAIARHARPPEIVIPEKPTDLTPLQDLAWIIDLKWRRRREFAQEVGLSEPYLCQILSGSKPISQIPFGTIVRLADVAGFSVERLAEGARASSISEVAA